MQRIKAKENLTFRAIIYTRVSSKEQVEGTSLGTQKEGCLAFCKREGLEVDRIFVEEGESAKVIDRTELKKLLEYARKNKGKISHLIVYKFDRFARNQEDHLWLRKELASLGITVKSITEPIDDSLAGKLQESILAVFNEYDNDLRRERCINGMEEKLKEGIWCRKPPIGYKIPKKLGAKEKKMLPDIPDIDKFPFIERAWKMYLTGNYTMSEVARTISKESMGMVKMYDQQLQHIFKNKFYCGIIVSPFSGQEYKGLHQPMITLEDFLKVQQIMQSKGGKIITQKLINPDFPLRGFIQCGGCKNPYTGSWSTARNKEKHAYYFCHKEGCNEKKKGVQKLVLEDDFLNHLREITPKKEFLKRFEEAVVKVWKDKYKTVNEDYVRYEKQLDTIKNRKNSLIDMKTKDLLSDKEFQEEKDRVNKEIEILELAKADSRIDMFELEATIEYAKHFIEDLPRQWFDLGVENKRRFQKLVFPDGLPYLRNGKFGTAKMSVIFELNQQLQNKNTNLVGPVGFEPTTKRLCFLLLLSQLLSNL